MRDSRTNTSVSCVALCIAGVVGAQDSIAGRSYTRLATREATREAFLASLGGSVLEWGRWMAVGPFVHAKGGKDIATAYEPEALLARMKPGAGEVLGPADQRATYASAGQKQVGWVEVDGALLNGAGFIDLDRALGEPGVRSVVGYLYRSVDAPRDMDLPVKMGSDDGLRVWLNGNLIVDMNAERSFAPDSETLTLGLKRGTNHLLVKVSQGAGEWRFGLATDAPIHPVTEAALDWQLAQDFPTAQDRHYRVATIPHPPEVSLEVGGLDVIPRRGKDRTAQVAVCTRRGEIYLVDGAFETPAINATYAKAAEGLHEPLGLLYTAYAPDSSNLSCFVAQRGELTKIDDADFDGRADRFETVCDAWTVSGNYHEYAFGPKRGPDGGLWVNLNLAHDGGDGTVMGAPVATRGWCVSIDPNTRAMTKIADGLRSPDGLVPFRDEMFYTDNQGDYVATNKLSWLRPQSFHGHQASIKFRDGYGPTWRTDGKPVPPITWPAVWFPYGKMGQSASDGVEITTDAFGPFKGQLLVGDQTNCVISRVFLEKVKNSDGGDWYQGACFPFLAGFASGVHRLAFAPDGSLFVGMTDRGWGSTGPKRDGLQRVLFTGNVPFEILSMRASRTGFMLEFTKELAPESVGDLGNFSMTSYTYDYRPAYGSPETDTKNVKIVGAQILQGSRHLVLTCEGLRGGGMGYVHELHLKGVVSKGDSGAAPAPLLHDVAYYTLQVIPAE